jgi:hypothetical protein
MLVPGNQEEEGNGILLYPSRTRPNDLNTSHYALPSKGSTISLNRVTLGTNLSYMGLWETIKI